MTLKHAFMRNHPLWGCENEPNEGDSDTLGEVGKWFFR